MSSKDKKKVVKGAASKAASSSKSAKSPSKPVSKPVAKPASKPAAKPVAKVAAKPVVKTAAKPVAKPASKPAAKPVAKVAAKPVSKPASKPAAKPVAKVAAKPVSKPAAKAVAKPVSKPVAKAVAKPLGKAVAKAVADKAATKPVAKAPVQKPAVKLVANSSAEGGVVAKTSSKPVSKPVSKTVVPEDVKVVVAPAHVPEKKEPIKEKELSQDDSVLLAGGKKPIKTSFFVEVDDAEERANKKKYSAEAKGPEKPTASSRRKSSLVEETPEELIERLAMELEEENMGILREAEMQICTKCGLNPISPEFRVDKDLGYCDECAEILRLGQTKEARKVDYQMSLMRKDAVAGEPGEAEDIEIDEDDVEEIDDED